MIEPLVGHEKAVVQLYETSRLYLVRIAVLLVDDLETAEDVVQDAFVSMRRRQGAPIDSQAMLAYLRTSVLNNARSVLRRRRVARRYGWLDHPVDSEPADAQVLLASEHRQVLEFVRRLPMRQRQVLILRYWAGQSEAEIANTLRISRGAVKSTASRALAKLGDQMEATR